MKILVTGGGGFIGSHIVEDLTAHHYDVMVLDNFKQGKKSNLPAAVRVVEADVLSIKAVSTAQQFAPDAIIHLASNMNVAESLANPMSDASANILGTVNMLTAARDAHARAFIYVSSASAVYGASPILPATESSPMAPMTPNGVSVRTSEIYTELFQQSGMRNVSLRLANVYGPRAKTGVVHRFATAMLNDASPTIFGSGEQTRDFVYVKDVARAPRLALESNANGVFNISSNSQISLIDLKKDLSLLTGSHKQPHFVPAEEAPQAQRQQWSYQSATQAFGWRPETSLIQGLKETVAFLKTAEPAQEKRLEYHRTVSIKAA